VKATTNVRISLTARATTGSEPEYTIPKGVPLQSNLLITPLELPINKSPSPLKVAHVVSAVLKDVLQAETSDLNDPISIKTAATELAASMIPLMSRSGYTSARDGIGATRHRLDNTTDASKGIIQGNTAKESAITSPEITAQQRSLAPSAAVDMAYSAA
jgi:hypothetical protein